MQIKFKNSTIQGYEGNFNKWINPFLVEYYLDQITGFMIHDLIYEHITGISMDARRGILKRLKRVFNMAVEEGILFKNPALGITVKVPEARQLVFNRAEIDTLLYEANKTSHPFYSHWAMALLTGMRNGELYALT